MSESCCAHRGCENPVRPGGGCCSVHSGPQGESIYGRVLRQIQQRRAAMIPQTETLRGYAAAMGRKPIAVDVDDAE